MYEDERDEEQAKNAFSNAANHLVEEFGWTLEELQRELESVVE